MSTVAERETATVDFDAIDLNAAFDYALECLDDPDALIDRLLSSVEKVLRQRFGLTYAECDLLLCDVKRDLLHDAKTFLDDQYREATWRFAAELKLDGAP